MTYDEAIAALNYDDQCPAITVRTRSGAEYSVAYDTIEEYGEEGYVYGYRTNGSIGPFVKRRTNGDVRWFDLKNVKLVEAEGESK